MHFKKIKSVFKIPVKGANGAVDAAGGFVGGVDGAAGVVGGVYIILFFLIDEPQYEFSQHIDSKQFNNGCCCVVTYV